jgi:hypothetical protein
MVWQRSFVEGVGKVLAVMALILMLAGRQRRQGIDQVGEEITTRMWMRRKKMAWWMTLWRI